MTRGASSAARQEALRRLIATDPSLASSVDTELLASITLRADLADNQPTTNMKKTSAPASKRRSNATTAGVTLYSESNAAGSSRDAQPAAVAPIVLLDARQLDRVAQVAALKEEGAVRRFDLASSLQSSSSCSSSASLPSPSSRAVGDWSSFRRKRTAKTPAPSSCRSSLGSGNSFSAMSDDGDASERGRRRSKNTVQPLGIQLSKSRSRDLIDRFVKSAKATIPNSESYNSLSRGASEQSDNNTSEDSEYEGSRVAVASVQGSESRIVLDHRCFVSRDQWVPHSARKACFVCLREFSMLRKRHSCRMCGEVVCSRCSVFKLVDLPIMDSKLRVCSSCFVAYRRKLEGTDDKEQPERHDDGEEDDNQEGGDPLSSSQPPSYVLIEPETMVMVSRSTEAERGPSARPSNASVFMSKAVYSTPTTLSPSCSRSDVASLGETITSSLSSFSVSTASFSSDWAWVDLNMPIIDSSAIRGEDDELEAVLRAKQLEVEVKASQRRIRLLETQIADQENQKDLLSLEQQTQLREARATIQALQEKLRCQEASAREAAHTRDSICLQNLHKMRLTELHSNAKADDQDDEDESAALRKRLKVLERQLQQAGISVAEVIPYEVAKRKVGEISRRLQELGSSDVSMRDKSAQADARKEYFLLEQEMEKYHTALLLTDEYIDEQRRKEQAWEDKNCEKNESAAKLLWSAIPVDISQLSERELAERPTPTGVKFPNELARRLKRTSVLQLMRVDPQTIAKMHPSVIEAYRTTGLTLIERRALHHVMRGPLREWRAQQQADEMARRKFGWYSKLKDALVLVIDGMDKHLASTDRSMDVSGGSHACDLVGMTCPVRSNDKMRALYGAGFGFPSEPEFLQAEILKGDPDGVGEKARKEAERYARDSTVVAQKRKRELQTHYGARNVREITLALGALEETDVLLGRVWQQDDAFPVLKKANGEELGVDDTVAAASESLLASVRELALALAKRAGISLSGKRELASDSPDSRSSIEVTSAAAAIAFVQLVMADVAGLFADRWPMGLQRVFKTVSELFDDVSAKNTAALERLASTKATVEHVAAGDRVVWRDRGERTAATEDASGSNQLKELPRRASTAPTTSSAMFDAIRARRCNVRDETDPPVSSAAASRPPLSGGAAGRPSDLLAAIRGKKSKANGVQAETQ